VLQKDRADVEAAAMLLAEIRRSSAFREISRNDLLRLRVLRIYARTLIRLRDRTGRKLILGLLARIGGASVVITRDPSQEERARFLSDLSGDLSVIGEHEAAIKLAQIVVGIASDPGRRAYRLGNAAAWHLQRAVSHRAAGEVAAALADLSEADELATFALKEWQRVPGGAFARLGVRETRAVAVSALVERAASEEVALDAARDELHDLLRHSLDPPRDESYLQVLYRIGRLGVVHLRLADEATGKERERRLYRARAYLSHAWRSSGNACVRPWMALDLLEAIRALQDEDALKSFALEAFERLEPQCGGADPAIARIKAHLN
jgi:hypothetical protein